MICPDCDSDGIPDNPKFGKVTCSECKTVWRYLADGLHADTLKPKRIPTKKGPSIRLQTVIRCMVCHGSVERDATIAYVQRPGGRWPIRGPVCKDCEGISEWTYNKAGEQVPRVRIAPTDGFYLPGSRFHIPKPYDGINETPTGEIKTWKARNTLSGLTYHPPTPEPTTVKGVLKWVVIHKRK